MRIPTKDHEVLKNFQVTFRVTSTAAPSVVINPEGVAVYSQLRLVIVVVVTIPTSSRTSSWTRNMKLHSNERGIAHVQRLFEWNFDQFCGVLSILHFN